ncbi:uncharacterized protein LOC131709355 isoform X2 [Acipenser ruthenus]|uniref:uncharacterized protein LOC131709355 isoform X2 n=1 Tax=Acipenser ruthenus TaxID=7906 RepID=UPI0027415C0B|nr:uncharacterized protein LOC131709355 isoform X2 [Acipenser ruthenus]
MEKETADVETVSGASGILSVSQSFGSFGRDYKSINPARDAKSMSWDRPYLSNPKIPGLLKRVFKGSDRKSRHQEVGEWSLEECRHSIMELAKEMNRVLKNSAIPTPVSSEDTCSLEECRCFIMKWAGELDKLVQQSQSAGQVETRKGAELRNKEDLPGPEGEELSEGAGQNQGEELDQEEEQRLKDGHDIIMQWARELKTVPENSVSAGEAVEQGVAELVKEWKRGKLSNILPIMEFIMWTLIKEEAKGMLKSQNIGAGRSIPDLVWQWIHKASVDSLTLDLDTAHPRLTLPVDEKHVRRKRQDHNNPQRFDYRRCVLGKEGFTSGRHYWELGVGENTFWRLGVSRESAPKKGKFSMTPQQGYWTVGWSGDEDKDEFTALTDPQTPLPPSLKPQKLGVYLDYEEGQLSFYNVETRSHIYTFTDMEFNPNEKLYPFFWSLEYKDLALVSPGKMNDSFFFLLVWKWILAASVDSLTLDLDTAHPRLTLPVDEKQERRKRQDHNNPQRFDYRRCVLGKEGFTSGRHYWELGVGENTFWRLGVSRESAPKKGKFSMTPQQGYWTVGWDGDEDKDEFTALTDPQTPLPPSLKPQKLGVYLDYEEGQLSFYNVETRSHIYTFTDMEFNPNEKLYPFFWSLEYKDLALVSPGKMIDSSFFLLVWEGILAASVDVTLDPDTAHPQLTLSAEGKRVRRGGTWQDLPNTPQRFNNTFCVLGREGFTSGRRYWQVQVGGNTYWRLGVSRESAKRKGGFSMTPQQGYWTVEWRWSRDEFTALTDPRTPLPLSLKPQKLGVYLDYEEGQLSFYNVETRSHIYTFTDMEFNPNEKLYPFFCTYSNTDLVLESPDVDPVSAAD